MKQDPLTRSTKPRVLLAEDDPDQSEMLSETLEDEGYTVDTAFSGDAAFGKLQHNHYDLIILDIRMPGIDGTKVLRQFRKLERGYHVPVIIVSAFATEADVKRYKELGADTSFSKPYEMDQLLASVSSFVPSSKTNGRSHDD